MPSGRFYTANTKQRRLATEELINNTTKRRKYQDNIEQFITQLNTEKRPDVLLKEVFEKIKQAAEDSVGYKSNRSNNYTYHDSKLREMSEQQRDIRLRIENCGMETKKELKNKRNRLLHEIRDRGRLLWMKYLDDKVTEIERLPPGNQIFMATRLLNRGSRNTKISVWDESEHMILDDEDKASRIADHFKRQFQTDDTYTPTFIGHPRGLLNEITPSEVLEAFHRMNNNRPAGYDGVPGELLKYAPNSLASFFAHILNKAFAQHCPLPIGTGIIIPVQKPGKRRGPCGSLRPVVLVTSLRKTLSTIVRSRISRSVDRYLSCSQSGFRPGKSTVDIVWTHRWINAICQKYKRSFHVLGIDMSKAFDSINRSKLLIVLKNIIDEDSLRMIHMLLSETQLFVRIGPKESRLFPANVGTPQGDTLSPILFVTGFIAHRVG
ncbi:uncharacterized protein LOC115227732 [Octopus sinensis]|uniref:Uncharacterized protein LOC115227732 n=1 Tax=Octopus sinensis TaxID=2607531 RepID=A0A6P7TQ55_9MOLL|nr:uncharacterized protein LOC115227732 [Octopus sinensis]